MDKIKSALISRLANVSVNKPRKQKLCLSIVSLILAAVVLVSATYCWYVLTQATGTTNNLSLAVGSGLRVNDLGSSFKGISDNSYLLPASSVDGRNMFFPADGNDFSDVTADMTFRSANAGDRNYNYVQLDFNLTAEAMYTGIYLHKDTTLEIDVPEDATTEYKNECAEAQKALRAAIFYDGMDAPVVFNAQHNPSSVNAVSDIDRTTGRYLESERQVAVPFNDYSYGKRQLAMLNQGETRPFSLIIWLEGTASTCTSANVMLKQLKLNLKFTTTWDNKETIKFTDKNDLVKTILNNKAYTLQLYYHHKYRDNNNKEQTVESKFKMYKPDENSGYWTCEIPDSAKSDIRFQIINEANNNALLYEWTQTESNISTLNRGTATEYRVDTVNQNNGTDSRGHWYDGDIEEQGYGYDVGEVDDDDW